MQSSITRRSNPPWVTRALKFMAAIEPREIKAVILSTLCFFCLFGSYSVVKPVRDTMGTLYGMAHIQELFTGTFIASFVFAPVYSWLASRLKLSIFLPWVYGFIAVSLVGFYGLSVLAGQQNERWVAAAFYVWVSTFNMLIISVFWTFMADLFSRTQAKRLFGFVAAGATAGGIVGPALATFLVKALGNPGLILISAAGFVITAVLVTRIGREKEKLLAMGAEVQLTTLDHGLRGSAFNGFRLLFRSRYLLLLAAFLLLMTWISTIVYIQLGDLITHSFRDKEARTQAYATIDLIVNSLALGIQLFGTGRLIERFGVTMGLLLNPVIMVVAFLAVVFSPVLFVLGGIQIIRRIAEYAIAKPTREMLFTVVDQESRYKAKNVIDTIIYRFGDLSSAWVSSLVLPFGVAGLAIFGAVVATLWFPVGYALGKRYEDVRGAVRSNPNTVAA
jgi:ATP:ADP antiporter, AAA family